MKLFFVAEKVTG